MFRSLPAYNYADILDAEMSPTTPDSPSSSPRSHAPVHYSMYMKRLSGRAIKKLPPEVLHQIFNWYFDLSPVRYTEGPLCPGIYNNMSQQLSPLQLGQVCAHWRAVVSTSPALWTSICIIGPLDKQAYAIDTWLTRAQSLPTDVLLIQLDMRRPAQNLEEATDRALEAIIRHSSYWRRLRLEIRISDYQGALCGIDPRKLQSLEAVHLEFPPWAPPRPEISRLWSNLYQAPRLSRVSWEASSDISPPNHLGRWQHLTWVNCGGSITQSNLWSILKEMPRLIRLRVRGICVKDPFQPPALSPLTCKSLQILDLEFKSSPIQFYCNLKAPNLTSLRITQNSKAYDPIEDRAVVGALTRFLKSLSDSSNFESLTILDPTISEPLLISLLHIKELRHIRYLGLDYATERIFTNISLASGSRRLMLPSLQKLEIFNRYLDSLRMTETVSTRNVHHAVKKLLQARSDGFSVLLNPCELTLTANTLFIV